jgi:hypothetical protein
MPGRIESDIKNRFNASLKKYNHPDDYMESKDKKKDKFQKKILLKQQLKNYKLRNANVHKKHSISKDPKHESGDKN